MTGLPSEADLALIVGACYFAMPKAMTLKTGLMKMGVRLGKGEGIVTSCPPPFNMFHDSFDIGVKQDGGSRGGSDGGGSDDKRGRVAVHKVFEVLFNIKQELKHA